MNAILNPISSAFKVEDYMSVDEVASELNLKPQRARQLIDEAVKRRLITNLVKKDGVKKLYAEPMVKQLKIHYENGLFGAPRKRRIANVKSGSQTAVLSLSVNIFDPSTKDILLKLFKNEAKISEYLTEKLAESYKPVMSELAKLESDFEAKKKQLLNQI